MSATKIALLHVLRIIAILLSVGILTSTMALKWWQQVLVNLPIMHLLVRLYFIHVVLPDIKEYERRKCK